VYNNWKKDGELRVAGVDIDDIQNKAEASDPEPENGRNMAVEHPDAEDGG
jgi:hypothetical protein